MGYPVDVDALSPTAAEELLCTWALEAGFDRAGVATLAPSERGDFFRRWLAAGRHASMAYLERRLEERLAPAALLPGARSALCVALRYYPLKGEEEPAGDLWPRVARYARGRDYHQVMERRLRDLAKRICERFPGCAARPYVDTGPVLERELAARAGLGSVGKNTCLLHRDDGSWFFLGELLLTLELEPGEPLADLCGSCTLCLEACPTGALPAAFELDSTKCISYWTIEHRGSMPEAARTMVGDWVFGCDICQEVCPWNRRRKTAASQPELSLPADRRELDLPALLGLARDAYVERFRGSPMKRAKLEGLQRNAAVAMGNRGDAGYLEPLSRALSVNPSPVVRSHAAWALGRVAGAPEVGQEVRRQIEVTLQLAAGVEGNAEVQEGISLVLAALRDESEHEGPAPSPSASVPP